jgi:DNA-directed RNA polymerase subunit RPC12/RpoP
MMHPYRNITKPKKNKNKNCFYIFHEWIISEKTNVMDDYEKFIFVCKNCGKRRLFKSYSIADHIKAACFIVDKKL